MFIIDENGVAEYKMRFPKKRLYSFYEFYICAVNFQVIIHVSRLISIFKLLFCSFRATSLVVWREQMFANNIFYFGGSVVIVS